MPKGAQAKAAKADAAAAKEASKSAAAERAEEEKWSKGAKGKGAKEDREDKAAKDAAKKAEKARLQAEEDAELDKMKVKAPAKKAAPAKKSASANIPNFDDAIDRKPKIETFSASGIDDALDMLDIATAKTDKASMGAKASKSVDTHPERRFKAAFEAYKERELPILKQEHKGLRLQQYEQLMFKNFQKSPDNPFNAPSLEYDAKKEDKVELLRKMRQETEDRYRVED